MHLVRRTADRRFETATAQGNALGMSALEKMQPVYNPLTSVTDCQLTWVTLHTDIGYIYLNLLISC